MELIEHRNKWYWGTDVYLVKTDGMGFVAVALEPGFAYIHNLCVHRRARRRGIGRALMEAAFLLAEREGYDLVRLTTDGPAWLGEWYEHLGFQKTGRKVDGLVEYERSI